MFIVHALRLEADQRTIHLTIHLNTRTNRVVDVSMCVPLGGPVSTIHIICGNIRIDIVGHEGHGRE